MQGWRGQGWAGGSWGWELRANSLRGAPDHEKRSLWGSKGHRNMFWDSRIFAATRKQQVFMCGLSITVLFILTLYFQRWVPGLGRGVKVSRGPRIAWCRRALWLLSYESPAEIFIRRREHIPVNRCLTVILRNQYKYEIFSRNVRNKCRNSASLYQFLFFTTTVVYTTHPHI